MLTQIYSTTMNSTNTTCVLKSTEITLGWPSYKKWLNWIFLSERNLIVSWDHSFPHLCGERLVEIGALYPHTYLTICHICWIFIH